MKFSCIIPAYNEGPRIASVLTTVLSCDEIGEVIVVNDGSTDNTREIIDGITDKKLRVFHLDKNGGKLHAFFHGIAHADATHIVMMDADYIGFTTSHLDKLIQPILHGEVDMTMMMWNESLPICKLLKHDIFSGARVLPKEVFDDVGYYLQTHGFTLEAKMNEVIYKNKLSMLSLYFPEVSNPSKGNAQIRKQFSEIVRSIAPWKIVRQAWYFYRQQP